MRKGKELSKVPQLYYKKNIYVSPNQKQNSNINIKSFPIKKLTNNTKYFLKSSLNKSNKKNLNKTDRTLSNLNDSEIDYELKTLYKKYFICKNSRRESEQDYNLINNKMHMLEKEEEKAKEKRKIYINNLKRKEIIQF